jgi:hypothetical protein
MPGVKNKEGLLLLIKVSLMAADSGIQARCDEMGRASQDEETFDHDGI